VLGIGRPIDPAQTESPGSIGSADNQKMNLAAAKNWSLRNRSKIGEGGMGEVYLVEDAELHRKSALKFYLQRWPLIPIGCGASSRSGPRRALNHPNIAHMYQIVERWRAFHRVEFVEVSPCAIDSRNN